MSGVEEVLNDPPDKNETEDKQIEVKEEVTSELKTASDSETPSLTGSWTILEKEEADAVKKTESETSSVSGSSIEVLDNKNDEGKNEPETDSDSIETISDDEILVAQSHANIASYCYVPDSVQRGTTDSLTSTTSTQSVISDGIPIKSQGEDEEDEVVGEQYEWNSEGEREIPEDRVEELAPSESDDVIESEAESERDRVLEPGEPGYDLDDDGLPGAPLPPLPQEVELYPSQELDPGFQVIKKEKIYKHAKNLEVDHFLTAILVLALALVIGLGIGHFLGLSERLEVQEMYENLQEERLDLLQGDLVSCIEGEEGLGGDDQDLDDRVIKQLWEENQDLRDQVYQLKSENPQTDEAMAAILRDRINDLLTANADLEREVARLRYNDAARGAAESVETLDKLRKTRDTLNDIVNENDQLKIEVGKARYGEPAIMEDRYKEERDQFALENIQLKKKVKELMDQLKPKEQNSLFDSIENAFNHLQESALKPILNKIQKDDFPSSWPRKRNEELKNSYNAKDDDENDDDDEEDDDDDTKSDSMNNLSKYLSRLLQFGSPLILKNGVINWGQAEQVFNGLKEDLEIKFNEAGALAKDDINLILNKFEELKAFVNTDHIHENIKATKTASTKLLKNLVEAIKDLREASEEAAEKNDWANNFKSEAEKIKIELEKRWLETQKKWSEIINDKDDDEEDDDDDDDDEDDDEQEAYRKKKRNDQRKKKWQGSDDNDDDDDHEDYKKKKKNDQRKNKWEDSDDDDDDEGYQSFDDEHENQRRSKHKHEKKKYYSETNQKINTTKTSWDQQRSHEREKQRKEKTRSDWIFERAKQRKEVRYEETRGDWYFNRKYGRETHEEQKHCSSKDKDCKEKSKGEKYLRRDRGKSDKMKSKGENKRFHEKVQYQERHFKDNLRKRSSIGY